MDGSTAQPVSFATGCREKESAICIASNESRISAESGAAIELSGKIPLTAVSAWAETVPQKQDNKIINEIKNRFTRVSYAAKILKWHPLCSLSLKIVDKAEVYLGLPKIKLCIVTLAYRPGKVENSCFCFQCQPEPCSKISVADISILAVIPAPASIC